MLGSASNFKGACFAFERTGSCEKGDACKFSHDVKAKGEDDVEKASLPATVIRVCYSFKDTGACDKGDACEFAHVVNVKKKKRARVVDSGTSGSIELDGLKKQKANDEEGVGEENKQAKLSKKERNKRAAIVRARGYKPNNYKER